MTKKIKVNKNKKKTWRKHADIADVEEYLDEIRFQERTGGIILNKKDEELFSIDKDCVAKLSTKPKNQHPLKCLSHLVPLNTFPDTTSIYGRFTLKKKIIVPTKYNNEHIDKNIIKTRKKKFRLDYEELDDNKFCQDLWLSDKSKISANIDPHELFDKDYATKLNLISPKVPFHHTLKPSVLKALPIPEKGMSYNPTFEDHQALLKKAFSIESKHNKSEEDILKRAKFTLLPLQEIESNKIEEMSEGLYLKEVNAEEEMAETPMPLYSACKVNRDNKKSKSKRRIKIMRKLKLKNDIIQKKKKRMLNDINRLKSLKKEIILEEKDHNDKLEKKKKTLDEQAGQRTKRLGKNKFVESEIDLQLSTELADCLRKLKPEGDILRDSFKSFQRRNLIEAHSLKTGRKKQKRYKPKLFERKVVKALVS